MRHTKSGSKLTELILVTFRLNGALIEAGDKLISDLGLTSARWQVLGSLTDGPITVPGIARKMGLSRQNVQRIVNRLIKDEFIETVENPDHRRAKLCFLTSFGKETMQEVSKRQVEWINQISKDMELVELRQSVEVMIDCRQRVQESLAGMQNDKRK